MPSLTLVPPFDDHFLTLQVNPEADARMIEASGRGEGPSLEAWTTEQLLGEALERSGQDVPALRQMERLILRALLTAHDAGQQRLASSRPTSA